MKTVILPVLSFIITITLGNLSLRLMHAGQLPVIEKIYEEHGIQKKVDIKLPPGYENIKPENKGKVYFVDEYDKEESNIASIAVVSIRKDGIVHAKITGQSTSILIKKGHFVKFLPPPQVPDTVAPAGLININNGSAYTNSRAVTLLLSATDNIRIIGYYISPNPVTPSANAIGWQSVATSKSYTENITYTLDSGEGNKVIYIWYKDAAVNISQAASDSIILDTIVPSITITSPTSAHENAATNEIITISGNASDSGGVRKVWWSNNGSASKYANGTTHWSADIKLSNGNNTVTVVAADMAGNTRSNTVTIFYKFGSFSVENHLMTGITPEEFNSTYKDCTTPPQKYSFLDTDICATQWFYYQNATIGDIITWKWYKPDRSLYYEDKGIIDTIEGCWRSYLNISGYYVSHYPAGWVVIVYRNGESLFSETFTISKSNDNGLHKCATCRKEMREGHICNLTFFCHDCKKEVGDGHICGITSFCTKCEEEVGSGHLCDITYFCYHCEKEVGDEHICGITHFCPTCKAEAGEGHICGRTSFCFDCSKEVPKNHDHSKTKDKSTTQSYGSKEVVVTVNGEGISQDDVDKVLNRFGNQINKEQIPAVTKQIVDGLITQKLIMQFIRDSKIEVSQAEIEKELNKVREDIKSNPGLEGQTLEQVLKSHGSSIEELKKDIMISLSLEKYLGKDIDDNMKQDVKQKIMEEKAKLLIEQIRERAEIKYFTQ
ncbi:MAG TPA: SurA N-terminal domain-containing protein [Candidatus Wunengus sp. YC63]|uniref:SurA N-terminal domain-containing protein n=1 Tax=Candidatus Wunengus sp. YC63 TaxID=3367699 RepID=UPI004026410B